MRVKHRPILGAGLMLCALAMLPGMDAIAKHLSATLPTVEVTWGRFLFYALVIGPIAVAKFGRRAVQPARPGLQVLRGLLFAGSAYAFFLSIAEMPLADTMAVFFIYPMVVLLASALILRERIGALRWVMVVLGFVGVLLVMQPSFDGFSRGDLFALVSGVGYALGSMVTRHLAPHDPSLITGICSALTGVLLYSFAMPVVWQAPTAWEWVLLAGVGLIAAAGHYLLITAHHMATAAQLAPYGYAEIVSAIFFGLIVFNEWPEPIVWLGIVVIVASGIVVTWSNARLETARTDTP
ncbi:DMT family transporter [Dongia sp.]|uniref:DMT family transporter n=1 Tax=Dongia sp. TaxID=1977262 RepID=UPI0037505A9B